MFSTQDVIATIEHEHTVIKHLADKVTHQDHLEYQPNAKQRSLHELLAYMTRMSTSMITMIKNKGHDPEMGKKLREDSEELNFLTDFGKAMDDQLIVVNEFLLSLSEDDLKETLDLFGSGTPMPVSSYIMFILRQYPAYRMQLFSYLKSGLAMTELNTMNSWMGVDGPMPG